MLAGKLPRGTRRQQFIYEDFSNQSDFLRKYSVLPENFYVNENNSSYENTPVTSLKSNKDQDKMNYINSICTDFSVNFTFA